IAVGPLPYGDGVVRVYNARTGQEELTLEGGTRLGYPVFSPDGTRIVVGPNPGVGVGDGVVRVFDPRTAQHVLALNALVFSLDGVRPASPPTVDSFSVDHAVLRTGGARMAAPDRDGVVRVWTAPKDPVAWQKERRQALAEGMLTWHRTQADESL